jgi:hypothetical protein
MIALFALPSSMKKEVNALIYWTLPRRVHLRCVWNYHFEFELSSPLCSRWQFARNWVLFLMIMKGSPMETVSSVSKWPDIIISINTFRPVCPSCHIVYFIYDYIALCPPKEVLKYLAKYVRLENRSLYIRYALCPCIPSLRHVGTRFSMN